jgi:hypothetical protein
VNRKRFLPFLILFILVAFLVPWVPAAAQTPTPTPTPALSCNPTSGFPNSNIIVTGSGFSTQYGVEAPITLTWDNGSIYYYPSPISVDNAGGFSRTISAPEGAAIGNHTIKAVQSLPNEAQLSATAVFKILPPELKLSPTSGFSTVTLAGKGFRSQGEGYDPLLSIKIYWDNKTDPELTVPSPVDVSWNGEFTAIISVPTQTVTGNHTVKAVQIVSLGDATGNLTAEASFIVIDMRGPQGFSGGGGIGPPGPAGPQGPAGAQGPSGPVGPTGPAGASGGGGGIGLEGPRGLQGMVGLPGPAGAQGASGPAGAIGPAGAAGPEGPSGAGGAVTSISIIALVVATGTLALFILSKLKKWIFS